MKRVVVTGIGVVSCLGNNQDEVYKSLLNAKSGITFSEEIQEIVILEKKLSSLNGWSNNQSITSISEKELDDLDAQHPKQIFRRSPGLWISRGLSLIHI